MLSAWGWGMSKVLDYLETDKAIDAKKVAVQGHSRDGKAALVALAYDERFATGFISSSARAAQNCIAANTEKPSRISPPPTSTTGWLAIT